MSVEDNLAQFRGQRYLNLESYRKNGEPVRTPLWFAEDGGLLYVYTESHTAKVRRIRRNPRVRVVPSSYSGRPRGRWVEAEAAILDAPGAARGHRLLRQKYLLKRMFDVANHLLRHTHVVVAIRILH